MCLGLPHYVIKAALSALLPRPGETPPAAALSDVSLTITDSLARHAFYEPTHTLRQAHTHDISSQLGVILLEALSLRESSVVPFATLTILSCMCDNRFGTLAGKVRILKCNCPPNHLEWFESDDESDGESD